MFVKNFKLTINPVSIPVVAITRDWFGAAVEQPGAYGFAADPEHFHFRATRPHAARLHPDARPGAFTANLWQYDAAEFFLVHPNSGRYLEFNLAPNGAWWSCEFTSPRQRARSDDDPFPQVVTTGSVRDDAWEATASLPLDLLRERLGFGAGSPLNATFTLSAPHPIFLTATPLGPGEPDFHQPDRLPPLILQDA